MREPYTKHLDDGIFELRCKLGSNLTRALFFFYIDGKIIITNGFIKKSQKTPPKEIKLAKSRPIFAESVRKMKSLRQFKAECMRDPEFAKAYEEMQPEFNIIRAIIDARISNNLTQKELAERTGIAQTEISRIENGSRNPSIKLLQRLADGMGMVLNVSFTPKKIGV